MDPAARPLRVLVTMPIGGLQGGGERLLADLLTRARGAGMEIKPVFFEEGALVDRARALGLDPEVIPVVRHNDPILGLRTIAALRRLIRALEPDVIVSWLARAHTWTGPAALLAGRRSRTVWWQHHISRGETLEAVIAMFPAAGVIATSQAAADAQAKKWPHRSTVVVHPGIEPPVPPAAAAVAALREHHGFPLAELAATVGRLVSWKGHHQAIAAVGELAGEGRDVGLLVVGGPSYGLEESYERELRELARPLGDRVVFSGHVDDPFAYIALADVLVSASDGEPFGLTLVEAMALGTPVVAVAKGGPLEIVEPDRSGLLAADDSPAALAAAIGRVLDSPELASHLAAGGRERFAERFTAERMAAEAERALRLVAARAARPAA